MAAGEKYITYGELPISGQVSTVYSWQSTANTAYTLSINEALSANNPTIAYTTATVNIDADDFISYVHNSSSKTIYLPDTNKTGIWLLMCTGGANYITPRTGQAHYYGFSTSSTSGNKLVSSYNCLIVCMHTSSTRWDITCWLPR